MPDVDDTDSTSRGGPPPGFTDPEPLPPRGLPDLDPSWRPSDVGTKIMQQFGHEIRERPDKLWFPHLIVRAGPGDTGARPLWPPTPCWVSPDILLFEEADGVDLSRAVIQPRVGQRYIVAVHVWNLGRFPAFSVLVRAWWVLPGFSPTATDPRYRPQFIGATMVDLGDRDSGRAHQIIPLPTPWLVQDDGGGHQCLFACAESFADPRGNDLFDANNDRHVAQRNLSLIRGDDEAAPLIDQLGTMLLDGEPLVLAVGDMRTPSLRGAVERGVATSSDVRTGTGPITMDPPRRLVATLQRVDGVWFTDRDSPDLPRDDRRFGRLGAGRRDLGTERLSEAIVLMLGAAGTTARSLLASPGIGDLSSAALHLSTNQTGYTVLLSQ